MGRFSLVGFALVCAVLALGSVAVTAQGPKPRNLTAALGMGFTYQGQLKNGGAPVNDTCKFIIRLYDDATSGAQIGGALMQAIPIVNGSFTTVLDFGSSAFDGNARWLDMQVLCSKDVGGYTTLAPRQALTVAPYALYSVNNWALNGNAGTNPGTNYVGTSDDVALTLAVNGTAALRLVPRGITSNTIEGSASNVISDSVKGGTIGAGGDNLYPNRVWADYGTIGGGQKNIVGDSFSTIGGGFGNFASRSTSTVGGGGLNSASGDVSTVSGGSGNGASGAYSTVSGGTNNGASGYGSAVSGGDSSTASGIYSTIGGGNLNQASGYDSTVGGGETNLASGEVSTVSGGDGNAARGTSSTIAGGVNHTANGDFSTVGGGFTNSASGTYSTVGGGRNNSATGNESFAAGSYAKANHTGTFVWADATVANFDSTGPNQFLVRASGGSTLYSDAAASIGTALLPGSGSWSTVSDRNAKANFNLVDGRAVVVQVATLPITTWNYKTQDATIRHIGPTAQDFHTAFAVGENDTTISAVDAQGVALAAIQGLYTILQVKDARLDEQESRLNALTEEVAALQKHSMDVDARLAVVEQALRVQSARTQDDGVNVSMLFNASGLLGFIAGAVALYRSRHGVERI
jgi:hypothetical protein